MKRKWIQMIPVTIAMLMCLGGCQIGNRQIVVSGSLSDKQVFKIGSATCGVKEAKVYLTNYQNIYGTAYGLNLWEHDFGDDSLTQYVKDITLEELTHVVCMDLLAESQEVSLSEEEKADVASAAKEYYASLSEDEIAYLALT